MQVWNFLIIDSLNEEYRKGKSQMNNRGAQRVGQRCSRVNQILLDPNDLLIVDFLPFRNSKARRLTSLFLAFITNLCIHTSIKLIDRSS